MRLIVALSHNFFLACLFNAVWYLSWVVFDQHFHESSFKFSCMIAAMSMFVKACLAPLGGTLWRRSAQFGWPNMIVWMCPLTKSRCPEERPIISDWKFMVWKFGGFVVQPIACMLDLTLQTKAPWDLYISMISKVLMTWFHHFWLDEGLTEISTQKCGKFESKRAKAWR